MLLLGVSILQYLDGVPDRGAVELLRYHAGWNFALNRQLGDELFHPTTLSKFRDRLLEHQLIAVAFSAILDGLVAAGLVARNSRQRLDSTQIFGLVSKMSRVEGVRETLRLALEELAPQLPESSRPPEWVLWWERYVESKLDYKATTDKLAHKLNEAGGDAARVLQWLETQPPVAKGAQVKLLAQVYGEQFIVTGGTPRARGKGELASDRVQNPHDPDATYAVKGQGAREKAHVGYKAQVAESVVETPLEPGEPTRNFITGIAIQKAHHSDEAGQQQMAQEQAAMGLQPPPVKYVDGAYISAAGLAAAAAQGMELVGPAQAGKKRDEDAFSVEDFKVDVEQKQAICPAGKPSDQCSRLAGEKADQIQFRFEWNASTCRDCPLRARCLGKEQNHKTLVVGEHHTALQARRMEQKTEAFQLRMRHRNAIEGTQSELVRAHGLRQARYRGLAKVRLQNYLAGAACNLKRWIRRQAWELEQAARRSSAPSAAAAVN